MFIDYYGTKNYIFTKFTPNPISYLNHLYHYIIAVTAKQIGQFTAQYITESVD